MRLSTSARTVEAPTQHLRYAHLMMKLLYLGVIGASLGLVSGCHEADRAEISVADDLSEQADVYEVPKLEATEQEIRGGQVDEERTGVVGMVIQQGWAGGGCSGSLIAPNLVLTAQHCIAPTPTQGVACGFSNFGEPFDEDQIYVTTRTEFPRFGYYSVSEIVIPEDGTGFCGRDIALMILSQNVPSSEALPIRPRLEEPVSVGERFTAAGYGHIGDGSGAGVRRSISNRRVVCEGFGNGCQDNNQGIYTNEWVGNDGTCQGDSGGPALDQDEQVIGVLSRGPEGCQYPVYTDVIRYAPWIREVSIRAAMSGGYEPPSWATAQSGAGSDIDEDEIVDRYDNCPEVSNPSQQDYDLDGVGDLCDEVVSGDRGGRCPVCNRCTTDEECGGQGAVCLTLQGGGVCTYPCRGAFECPDTTDCVELDADQKYCFNADIFFSGLCPSGFQCGGPAGVSSLPEDDGACHVCDSCTRGEDCASGVCASIGGSPKVCTRSCESDDDCREGSVCANDNGRRLCVNEGFQEAGICPADFTCAEPMMSMEEPAGEESAGEESAGEESAGEESAGDDMTPDVSGEMNAAPKDEGCSTTVQPADASRLASLWLLLALLYISRRNISSGKISSGKISSKLIAGRVNTPRDLD